MKAVTDEGCLDKIDGPFISLTAAIICHSLQYWSTGIRIDNGAFTRATSRGKKNNTYWQVSKVSRSLNGLGMRTLLKIASTRVGGTLS